MTRIIVAILCVQACWMSHIFSQELTLSPYSRYAIGDIVSSTTTRNAAMGGISVATDNYFSINRANPASYADMYFTTMDVSVFGQFSGLKTNDAQANQFTAGFQNVAFAFPSNKNFVLTMGFSPYSAVGYKIKDLDQVQIKDTTFTQETNYEAEGGLNQAFIGGAWRLMQRRLRIGANVQYIFGNTQYFWETFLRGADSSFVIPQYRRITVTEDVFVKGLSGQLGFIYEDTVNAEKGVLFRVGATADLALNVNGDRFVEYSNNDNSTVDTLGGRIIGSVEIPPKFGVGFMINRPGYWSLGADITYQDWSNFTYFTETPDLGREIRASIGGEWTPDYQSLKYFNRINYRAGAFWRQSYITIGTQSVSEYGVTVGFALPSGLKGNTRLNQGRAVSRVNLSAELGRRGSLNDVQQLSEIYARIRLGITVNDRWFIRRVVD